MNQSNLTIRQKLADDVSSFAARVDGDNLTLAVANGPGSPQFKTVQTTLKAIQAENPAYENVYTVSQQNGTIRFMVDSAYGEPDGSSPGDLYERAPKELNGTISVPGSTAVYTDDWGTFVSGYAPVRNSSGAVAGVLLIDVPFSELKANFTTSTSALAAKINVANLTSALAKGEKSSEYLALAQQLKTMVAEDPRIDYINIFQQVNGKGRFVADSEFGAANASHLGDTDVELPSQVPSVVNTPGATDVYTDQWGTGFTAYAPIKGPQGNVIAVFRADAGME
jgi:hypothetical protein